MELNGMKNEIKNTIARTVAIRMVILNRRLNTLGHIEKTKNNENENKNTQIINDNTNCNNERSEMNIERSEEIQRNENIINHIKDTNGRNDRHRRNEYSNCHNGIINNDDGIQNNGQGLVWRTRR